MLYIESVDLPYYKAGIGVVDNKEYKPSRDDAIYTLDPVVYELYKNQGYLVEYLDIVLGLKSGLGLYEVFSYFFDGKVSSDIEMVDILFKGLIIDSDYTFCVKIDATFCWFCVESDGLRKLGSLQFSEPVTKYSVGRFVKRLRFNMAKSGINLNKVRYYTWSDKDIDIEFARYIPTYATFCSFFDKVSGLSGLKIGTVMDLLSKTYVQRRVVTADMFVSCLNDCFSELGIESRDGVLYSSSVFLKDYSSLSSPLFNIEKSSFGVIIDCEGVESGIPDEGFSEIGGIIYGRCGNVMLSLETFSCDMKLFEPTLVEVIRSYTGYYNKVTKLCIHTFGSTDKLMFLGAVEQTCSSKLKKYVYDNIEFIDEREVLGDISLNDAAKKFNVVQLLPKHRALNDAKTLFNIMASYVMRKGGTK